MGKQAEEQTDRSEKPDGQPSPKHGIVAMAIPQWFLAIIGIVYSAGFLIVTTHLNSIGFRDAGGELWKARYIHAGILCIILPFVVIATAFSACYLFYHWKEDLEKAKAERQSPYAEGEPKVKDPSEVRWLWVAPPIVMLVCSEVMLYMLMLFSRGAPMKIGALSGVFGVAITITILAVSLLYKLARADGRVPAPASWWNLCLRLLCMLSVVVLFFIFFDLLNRDLGGLLSEMWKAKWDHLAVFVLVIVVAAIVIWLVYWRRQHVVSQERRRALWFIGLSFLAPILYLGVLEFTYSLYPYIPLERGGGDYSTTRMVAVTLKEMPTTAPTLGRFAKEEKDGPDLSRPLIIVEADPKRLYLASPEEMKQWREKYKSPSQLLSVSRDTVLNMTYVDGDSSSHQSGSAVATSQPQAGGRG